MAVGTRMQQRRATEAEWTTSDYVLANGELGVTTDTGIIKIGDGVTAWSALDPAFDSHYLPLLGTAANSELLDGVSAAFFAKSADFSTTPEADSYVQRTANGRVKGATPTEADDLTTLDHQTTAIAASAASSAISIRRESIVRTVTAATSIVGTDVGQMLMVNHSSLTAQVVVTINTNAFHSIATGSWVDICAIGNGGVKIAPAAGVTLRGAGNVMPNYGVVRVLKIGTDEWLGIETKRGRLPKIRAAKTTATTYPGGSYSFVPYQTIDSAFDFYNPDNEWFSIGGAGLPITRRIIVNKDGEYLINANFLSNFSGSHTVIRIALMVADNTLAGGRPLATQTGVQNINASVRVRLTAGQSIGVGHYPGGSNQDDIADGTFDHRNDLIITRIGD